MRSGVRRALDGIVRTMTEAAAVSAVDAGLAWLGIDMAEGPQREILTGTAGMSGVWLALYLVLRLVVFRRYSSDFSNRWISILHGIVAAVYSAALVDWSAPFAAIGRESTLAEARAMSVSLAYFCYDFVVCLFIDDDFTTPLHHVASIAGLFIGAVQMRGGAELVLCLLVTEPTSPLLHLNYVLKEMGRGGSTLATIVQAAFAAVFFALRICFSPYLVYRTLISEHTPIFVKVSGLALQLVSFFWFYKIVKIAAYKMGKSSGKAKKKA